MIDFVVVGSSTPLGFVRPLVFLKLRPHPSLRDQKCPQNLYEFLRRQQRTRQWQTLDKTCNKFVWLRDLVWETFRFGGHKVESQNTS
eukprot:6040786-Amphidinium_carterae.2